MNVPNWKSNKLIVLMLAGWDHNPQKPQTLAISSKLKKQCAHCGKLRLRSQTAVAKLKVSARHDTSCDLIRKTRYPTGGATAPLCSYLQDGITTRQGQSQPKSSNWKTNNLIGRLPAVWDHDVRPYTQERLSNWKRNNLIVLIPCGLSP